MTRESLRTPRLKKNIALAMMAVEYADIDSVVDVAMPGGPARATVVERLLFDPKKKLAAF